MPNLINKTRLTERMLKISRAVESNASVAVYGTITRITGMRLEASGLAVPVGTVCKILVSETVSVNAEVVGFSDTSTFLMATENIRGIKRGAPVISLAKGHTARVDMSLLGRVLDASGNPIDGGAALQGDEYYPLASNPINPLARQRISQPLDVGIRAINALLTVSKGQRLGIFSGSGVGKSVLLGMMTRFTQADVVVVGLIGERSREVKEFIEESLGKQGLSKAVVVASPADTSPLMRVNGASLATAIAEYYRDQGKDVLLILDSLTRFAQAQREISLSIGEMPATKGYTPSVFASMAQLVERSGNGKVGQGSITAFYTVLVEGDDHNDPIADHARSLLDGHIFLSRHLAEAGHYPAIDVEKSISRVMSAVVGERQVFFANQFKKYYSAYTQHRELINVGMYQHGSDKIIDEAIKYRDQLDQFLTQGVNDGADMNGSVEKLFKIFSS